MIHQRHHFVPVVAALVALLVSTPAFARVKAGTQVEEGLLKHVSTDNIKVYNPTTKQTLAFSLVPRFGNVFKANGRTAQQVSDLRAGQYVKVYYDQKALGVKHADRILIMNSDNMKMKTDKS